MTFEESGNPMISYLKDTRFYRKFKSASYNAVSEKFYSTVYSHESVGRLLALADGAEFAATHMKGATSCDEKREVRERGLALMPSQGLILEFGVWSGASINTIADYVGQSRQVHGFDSFEGLPEDWFGGYTKGLFHTQGKLPEVRSNVQLHVGWFDKTLPDFVAKHRDNIAFLHVDCDLYSSTKTIFDLLGDRLVPGSVILFDEYFNYPSWRDHEHRAFQELVQERSLKYRWIAYNRVEWNAAVQIIE
jgi:hypothetical protein